MFNVGSLCVLQGEKNSSGEGSPSPPSRLHQKIVIIAPKKNHGVISIVPMKTEEGQDDG